MQVFEFQLPLVALIGELAPRPGELFAEQRDLPRERYGPGQTVWRRLDEWRREGRLDQVKQRLLSAINGFVGQLVAIALIATGAAPFVLIREITRV